MKQLFQIILQRSASEKKPITNIKLLKCPKIKGLVVF